MLENRRIQQPKKKKIARLGNNKVLDADQKNMKNIRNFI